MFSLRESTKALIYIMIFTAISSIITFYVVVRAYDDVFMIGYSSGQGNF